MGRIYRVKAVSDGSGGTITNALEKYTKILTSADVANKYVTLPDTPANAFCWIENGGKGDDNVDWEIIGDRISWDGLAWESQIEVGNTITVFYWVSSGSN